MRRLRLFLNALKVYGIDLPRLARAIRGVPRFLRDYLRFRNARPAGWPIRIRPFLGEYLEESGRITTHYFRQDIYVAREIHGRQPRRHLDIGSRVDGFVSHLAVFRCVEVMDIRPLGDVDRNIEFLRGDLCAVPPALVERFDSVSCLHTVEHIGLGRYGDPVGADQWIVAIQSLRSLLQRQGYLYLSVPIGSKRVEFNAQRVFDLGELADLLGRMFTIEKLAIIDDNENLREYQNVGDVDRAATASWKFGCAIFVLKKVSEG